MKNRALLVVAAVLFFPSLGHSQISAFANNPFTVTDTVIVVEGDWAPRQVIDVVTEWLALNLVHGWEEVVRVSETNVRADVIHHYRNREEGDGLTLVLEADTGRMRVRVLRPVRVRVARRDSTGAPVISSPAAPSYGMAFPSQSFAAVVYKARSVGYSTDPGTGLYDQSEQLVAWLNEDCLPGLMHYLEETLREW